MLDRPFSIFPLGDSAMTLELGHLIDEQANERILALREWFRERPFQGLVDVIVAYSSITLFYDPLDMGRTGWPDGVYKYVQQLLEEAWAGTEGAVMLSAPGGEPIRIPVCYGGVFGPDLQEVSDGLKMSPEDVIGIHCATVYRVYMIGFLPGFPYLGRIASRLEIGRKPRPMPVMAGGVGIAGNQTGIYPVNSPGGWHIIGRTPFRLFDPEKEPPVKLDIGDMVQFYSVNKKDFERFVS